MKKILAISLAGFLFLSITASAKLPKNVLAAPCSFSITQTNIPAHGSFTIQINGNEGTTYTVSSPQSTSSFPITLNSSQLTFNLSIDDFNGANSESGQFTLFVRYPTTHGGANCDPADGITITVGTGAVGTCSLSAAQVKPGDSLTVNAYDLVGEGHAVTMTTPTALLSNPPITLGELEMVGSTSGSIHWTKEVTIPQGTAQGQYIIRVDDGSGGQIVCDPSSGQFLTVIEGETGTSGKNPCATPDPNDPNKTIVVECPTAFGNIPTDITAFAEKFLSIAIGIAGGIALILLVFGSIRVLTSSGNQQTLAAGRDTIIAAIAGLLFLIFSVLILRALGIIVGINLT